MRINRLYSRELRAARRAAEFIEGHDVFTTISLWAFGLLINIGPIIDNTIF